MGVRKTTDVVEKLTWGLAAAMVIISVACAYVAPTAVGESSVMENSATTEQTALPAMPGANNAAGAQTAAPAKGADAQKAALLLMLRRLPPQFLQLQLSNFSTLLREI